MNKRRVIIGLGTGRCGTKSLSALLNAQPGTRVTHEAKPPLPWEFSTPAALNRLGEMLDRSEPVVGDVGFYWLPYARFLLELPDLDVRFICLHRRRDEVINSFERKATENGRNLCPWIEHDGSEWDLDRWYHSFPKFDVTDRREAISRYVSHYEEGATYYDLFYADFAMFETDELNTDEWVSHILDHAGYGDEANVVSGIRLNESVQELDPQVPGLCRETTTQLRLAKPQSPASNLADNVYEALSSIHMEVGRKGGS